MSNNAKLLRGQLRQIVKDELPNMLASEIFSEHNKKHSELIKGRLDEIFKLVKDTLDRIDSRQKDVQSLVMRELASGLAQQQPPAEEPPASTEQKSE